MKASGNIFLILSLIILSFICVPMAFASEAMSTLAPAVDKPVVGKPVQKLSKRTFVAVAYEGTDNLGAKLSLQLKETFNSSNLFVLESKDVPKIILTLTTKAEFPARPNIASIYSIIWTYNQSASHLGYLLSKEIGTIVADDISSFVNTIVEKTDMVAVKYGYLF